MYKVGCSGFHYKHWVEIFYPKGLPQRKWFEFYNQHFDTLELNVTFYRFPRIATLETWYNLSAPDFLFSVKVPKAITHFKQFNDTQRMMGDFYGTVKEGLKEKLGCVLFQMPPRFSYTEERLAKMLDNIDPDFKNVFEFRNATWWNSEVYENLSKNKITFCGMSHPDFPGEVIQNTPTVYYRMHGVPLLYQSPYTLPQLKNIASQITANPKSKGGFIYFNNDIGGSAIKNAMQMKKLLQGISKKR